MSLKAPQFGTQQNLWHVFGSPTASAPSNRHARVQSGRSLWWPSHEIVEVTEDDAVPKTLKEALRLPAVGDHDAAEALLEELVKELPKRQNQDEGLKRLVPLLQEVVELHRRHHQQEQAPETQSAQPGSRPGLRERELHRAASAPSAPPLPLKARRSGSLGGASPEVQRLFLTASIIRGVRDQVRDVRETPTALHLVAEACAGVDAFLETLLAVSQVWVPIVLYLDYHLAPRTLCAKLKSLRTMATNFKKQHPLLSELFLQLALEVEILESLVLADFKVCLLKIGDAFAELVRNEGLLTRYLGSRRPPSLGGLHRPRMQASPGLSAAPSGASVTTAQIEFLPDRASLIARSPGPAGSLGGAAMDVSEARSPRSRSPTRPDLAEAGGQAAELTQVEKWLVNFHCHLWGKLLLLASGGLYATRHARQAVTEQPATTPGRMRLSPCSSTRGSVSRTSSPDAGRSLASPSNSKNSVRDEVAGHLPGNIGASRSYIKNLQEFVSHPGVLFAGVFVNLRQLPHLQAEIREKISSGVQAPPIPPWGLAAFFHESAWLVPFPPHSPERVPHDEGADCYDWLATGFTANMVRVRQAEDNKYSTTQTDVADCHFGLQALEACRHLPELKRLLTSLNSACKLRHQVQRSYPAGKGPSQWLHAVAAPGASAPVEMQPATPRPIELPLAGSPPSTPHMIRKRRYVQPPRRHSSGTLMLGLVSDGPDFPDGILAHKIPVKGQLTAGREEDDNGVHVLVEPLDNSWFPAPLFLCAVLRVEPGSSAGSAKTTPKVHTRAFRKASASASHGDDPPRGAQQPAQGQPEGMLWSQWVKMTLNPLRWLGADSVEQPDHAAGPQGAQDCLKAAQEEFSRLAAEIGGLALRTRAGK